MATEPTQVGKQNVQDALANLGQNRKMVLTGAVFVTIVIALIILVFAWTKGTSKGEGVDLVKRIDQARAFEIVAKLKSNEIESKLVDSDIPGKVNIQVYDKQFDDAAITLSRSDLLQEDGFNLFDKSDWAASDYDKRVKMTRATNGDLSRIVSRMSGMKWATVRINVPEPQLFSQYEAPTTATVQVETTESEGRLSRSHVRSIINLLVGYIPNLQKSNISIIDTNGQTYSAVDTEEIAASELLEETEKVSKTVQKRIEEYLEPILGSSNFIVRVSADITRKRVQESSTTFANGVIGQEQVGNEILGGTGVTDIATGPAVPGAEGGKGYSRLNKSIQRYPSFKQKSVSVPPGNISKIAVAVAINGGLPPTVSLKQLKEGIAAITSPSTIVDDVKITIAEFARAGAQKAKAVKQVPPKVVDTGNLIGQISTFFQNISTQIINTARRLPLWANITIAILGLFIILNSIGKMMRPPQAQISPTQSTISQINQRAQQQRQLQGTVEEPAKIESQEKADLAGILSGLQEAATQKPETLANKLEIWLEEGTPGRI